MANIADLFAQHLKQPRTVLYRHCPDEQWLDVTAGELATEIARWQPRSGARLAAAIASSCAQWARSGWPGGARLALVGCRCMSRTIRERRLVRG
jgi:hypothetical protein